jgi:hypothetical protein
MGGIASIAAAAAAAIIELFLPGSPTVGLQQKQLQSY